MKLKYLLPILLIIAIAGCIKDRTTTPTRSQLLTTHTWYVQSVLYDGKSIINPCLLDNYFVFSTNGNGYYDEGATRCNPLDSQRYNFNYALTQNDSVLYLSDIHTLLVNIGNNTSYVDSPVNSIICHISKFDNTYLDVNFQTKDSTGHKHNYYYEFVDN